MRLFAHSNSAIVWWKVAVPVVSIIALLGSMKAEVAEQAPTAAA